MAVELIREEVRDLRKLPLPCSSGGIAEKYITETGLRPGEKLEEELSYGGEQVKTAFPKVFALREDARRVMRWNDFTDLMMAAKCRHKTMALEKLWEIVS